MNTTQPTHHRRVPKRPLAADWARLSPEAQEQALEIARHEGRRAARWYLAEVIESGDDAANSDTPPPHRSVASLRRCRWAQAQAALDQVNDDVFYLFVTAHTLPLEADYLTWIIEPYCPERISWWWRTPREARLEDPRVCAFCDAYERERCRILGLEAPPTGITDLQAYLWEVKEQERESGRLWLSHSEEPPSPQGEEPALSARSTPSAEVEPTGRELWCPYRWEHQRCMHATDLAQMLLDAARYWACVR